MRAVVYDAFGAVPEVRTVADPSAPADGVVVRVRATGVCRSDWHGWQGHDPDIVLPHVPGHEFAGDVVAMGDDVSGWAVGTRVTAPFVCACGTCPQCRAGQHQVCDRQEQPGFTFWGSFADYVVVPRAMVNLVALPGDLPYDAAASLGCRYATAFRAVVDVAAVRPGEWVAVHGCGGVGLSAVAIAAASGARVIAVDVEPGALAAAAQLGAEAVVDASSTPDAAAVIREVTGGGCHVSMDALGSPATCAGSIRSLRTRGRHVQVGLLPPAAGPVALPMDLVVGRELAVLGSHGMAAHDYPRLLGLVTSGALDPGRLVGRRVRLDDAAEALARLGPGQGPLPGVTVIMPDGILPAGDI